ncbi:LuxR C-terminal-related transcriptional regulator [Pelagibaculum spongiae]|uniref:HTH luxR-type domain-containing protein n=1 Tax=Pelagibaculum spongiae TaxID=2080658 RepID=A0A2V1GXY0_9GAMM|nr:hypothetical protein DC094_18200 [Pelagibaculum spongiae]
MVKLHFAVSSLQFAYELGIPEAIIRAHITAILKKLGLSSRTQVALALQQLQADN